MTYRNGLTKRACKHVGEKLCVECAPWLTGDDAVLSAQRDESFALKNGARYENQDAQKKQTMDGIGRGASHSTGIEKQVFMIKRKADFLEQKKKTEIPWHE